MIPATIKPVYLLAGVAALGAFAWFALRGAKGIGRDIGSGTVDLVDGVVTGSVITAGVAVGIPETNMTKCQQAMAEGRTWDASFDCPAAEFLRYLRS